MGQAVAWCPSCDRWVPRLVPWPLSQRAARSHRTALVAAYGGRCCAACRDAVLALVDALAVV